MSETLGVYKKTWPSQAWIIDMPELTKQNIGAIKSDVKSVTLIKLEFLLAKALSSKPQDMLSRLNTYTAQVSAMAKANWTSVVQHDLALEILKHTGPAQPAGQDDAPFRPGSQASQADLSLFTESSKIMIRRTKKRRRTRRIRRSRKRTTKRRRMTIRRTKKRRRTRRPRT